jgi:hypothetical protein
MDEDPRKWSNQYYSNIGGKEALRFGCAISLWILLGMGLGEIFHSKLIMIAFAALLFIFSLLSLLWRPIYLIHRKILGNLNLPTEPIPLRRMKTSRPVHQPIPWLYQVPAFLVAILKIVTVLLVMYFIFKLILIF